MRLVQTKLDLVIATTANIQSDVQLLQKVAVEGDAPMHGKDVIRELYCCLPFPLCRLPQVRLWQFYG